MGMGYEWDKGERLVVGGLRMGKREGLGLGKWEELRVAKGGGLRVKKWGRAMGQKHYPYFLPLTLPHLSTTNAPPPYPTQIT
jgi:hypothetical protein